jgi:hypothetical protein
MSPKINWSAFIYTRTYSVDYRILVVPDDFTEKKKEWVKEHIREVNGAIAQQSFGAPEELLQRLFLSDVQHYVFGLYCNLKKLLTDKERKDLAEKYLSQADEKAKDLTVDEKNRLMPFTFLGYVIPKNSNIPELPPIRFDLEIFKPLCEYICHKWLEKTQSPPTLLPYNIEEAPERLFAPCPKLDSLPSLNTNPRNLVLHPGAESYTQQLWTAAARCEKPQTLWIGQLPENRSPESILVSSFPEKRTLLESRFLNIALPNIDSRKNYSKQPPDERGGEPPLPDGNLLDSISSFLAGEMEKFTGVFSNKSDDYETKLRALQANFEEFKRKHDKEISELHSLYSELKELQNKRENL